MKVVLENIYARAIETGWREIEGETLIVDLKNQRVISVNETAAAIWQALDGKTPLKKLIEKEIVANFDVPLKQALLDVEKWFSELIARGLVVDVTAR